MTNNRPARYYKQFDNYDIIEDTVVDSSGKTYKVTMRGWYWKNLDWMTRNTICPEEIVTDHAVFSGVGVHGFNLSNTMESCIWSFIEAYDRAKKGDPIDTERMKKSYIGHA